MQNFTIDFFELLFLAETCIPPVPIARTMFWRKLIDEHHDAMTERQRSDFLAAMMKNPRFDTGKQDCRQLFCRYARQHQYRVKIDTGSTKGEFFTYFFNGLHYINREAWLPEKYIVSKEKLYEKKI